MARDPRWGRVEETIGADPYLVGVLGTAYVRGLQSTGVIATLKHFAGYSGSRAGRNMAPVSVGKREFATSSWRHSRWRSRKAACDRSCIPTPTSTASPRPRTAGCSPSCCGTSGFEGVVVADYYGISFLETLHGVACSPSHAAALALRAGVDTELPNVRCYGQPLADAVISGEVPEYLVDRAAGRVLRHKFELGLLDPGHDVSVAARREDFDFDPPAHRDVARRLAEESVILLANAGQALPLRPEAKLAVVGPLANDPLAFFGCYTFPGTSLHAHPDTSPGMPLMPVLTALRQELPQAQIQYAPGCDVRGDDARRFRPRLTARATPTW